MSFWGLLRAEYKLMHGELFRRPSALASIVIYPYLFAGFVLFFGYTVGSPEAFEERLGTSPVVYMVTASYLMLSIMAAVDDVLWRPLSNEWIGTEPYVIASPVNKLKYYLAIPIPRLSVIAIMSATSVVPIYAYYFGFEGLLTSSLVIFLTLLGSVLMILPATIVMSIVSLVGESWRVINIVRPIAMILLGVYYPRAYMPLAMHVLSSALPASHVVEAVQGILGNLPLQYHLLLSIAIALALLYTPLSYRSVYYWERRKVRKGCAS